MAVACAKLRQRLRGTRWSALRRLISSGCVVTMHIITRKRLNEFAAKHPYVASALQQWYKQVKPASFHSFVELRHMFPSADQVGKLTVFNIGGNTARLIAAIHYNRQRIYI